MADTLDTLTKLVLKHDRTINAAANMLADLGYVLSSLAERCTACHDEPATVRHALSRHVVACDACAARSVVEAKSRLNEEFTRPPLVVYRGTAAANDLAWIDLPHATEVRRVVEYVRSIQQGLEGAAPPFERMH